MGEYIDMADYDVPVTEAVEVPHVMDGTLAFGATDVLLVDSVLLIVRQFSDHFIHLVDLRSGETVAKVQHVGRGPGEAVNTFCAGVSGDGEYFWAHDMQLGRINVYRMSDVLSGNEPDFRGPFQSGSRDGCSLGRRQDIHGSGRHN